MNTKREPVMVGGHFVTFTPLYIPGVGPRVMVADTCPGPRILSPENARLFASYYQIAAAEADGMAKRAHKRTAAA